MPLVKCEIESQENYPARASPANPRPRARSEELPASDRASLTGSLMPTTTGEGLVSR